MRPSLVACLAAVLLAAAPFAVRAQQADVPALVKKLNSPFDLAGGANALGKLGAKAKSALPDLGKTLKKAAFQSDRVAVAAAMEKIIRAMRTDMDNLTGRLKGASRKERAVLTRQIDEIRTLSKGAADDLGDALLSGKAAFSDDRLAVTKAIAACSADAAGKGVKGLAAALKGGFAANRIAAANALGELGPVAREAIPALTEAARSGFADDRKAAADALKKIGK
jgi:hypothetical protein